VAPPQDHHPLHHHTDTHTTVPDLSTAPNPLASYNTTTATVS
jgi:hypothetical protein